MDVHSVTQRSRNMSAIKSKNTKPEIEIRKRLHRLGYRYRLHVKSIIGKPDIVLRKYRAVIFIHGCFWHYHGCRLSKLPSTRRNWWKNKLELNKSRDAIILKSLLQENWRVFIVWECSYRSAGTPRNQALENITDQLSRWLLSDRRQGIIPQTTE